VATEGTSALSDVPVGLFPRQTASMPHVQLKYPGSHPVKDTRCRSDMGVSKSEAMIRGA
jgi:hypothetical protein